jgi:hypothetical protein
MNAALFFYFAEMLNNIGILLGIIGIGGIILFGMATIVVFANYDRYHGKDWAWIIPSICLVITCFIPSSKTMYIMAGAILTEKAIDTKVGQQIIDLLELKLDDELKKARDEITKEKK